MSRSKISSRYNNDTDGGNSNSKYSIKVCSPTRQPLCLLTHGNEDRRNVNANCSPNTARSDSNVTDSQS